MTLTTQELIALRQLIVETLLSTSISSHLLLQNKQDFLRDLLNILNLKLMVTSFSMRCIKVTREQYWEDEYSDVYPLYIFWINNKNTEFEIKVLLGKEIKFMSMEEINEHRVELLQKQ